MARLIDADAFAESLISCTGLGRRSFEAVLNALKEQPTAYDVDKVLEQLEKELKQANEDKERYIHGNPLEFDMANRAIGYAVGINYAIEMVRKGGVSNETVI